MGEGWEIVFFGDLAHFLDGLLDSLANRFPSGATSFEKFSPAQQ